MVFAEFAEKRDRLLRERIRLVNLSHGADTCHNYAERKRLEKTIDRLDVQLEQLDEAYRRG